MSDAARLSNRLDRWHAVVVSTRAKRLLGLGAHRTSPTDRGLYDRDWQHRDMPTPDRQGVLIR